MDRVIVTIADKKGEELMDLELPINQKILDVLNDINQTIEVVRPEKTFNALYTTIIVERGNRKLSNENTLEEEKVWNGDKLLLTSV